MALFLGEEAGYNNCLGKCEFTYTQEFFKS